MAVLTMSMMASMCFLFSFFFSHQFCWQGEQGLDHRQKIWNFPSWLRNELRYKNEKNTKHKE